MPAEEDYESISDLAERLGLDDDEKENFISSAMGRLGYVAKKLWNDPEPEANKGTGQGDFFSTKRAAREQRPINPQRGSRPAAGGYQ